MKRTASEPGLNYRGPAEGWTPVIKCRRFLSFFQRYIVRDISLTEIYRWLIEILSAILKSTRHGGQSRKIIAFWGTTRSPTFRMH